MCGIAGIVSLDGRPIADAERRVATMIAGLRHRGPDSQGVWIAPGGHAALGHARLAIVDPANPWPQPMHSADGGGVLAFNGEIYNYLDKQREWRDAGIPLRTKMDTEVLLEGLRRRGPDYLETLDGMWAFAYWDVAARSLLLGRDLMGERHLYFRIAGGELSFASEITPLVVDSSEPLSLDIGAALTALRFGTPPPGASLVTGIHRLRPGHVLRAGPGQAPNERRLLKLHPERWFDFFTAAPSEEAVIARYEEVLHRACRDRVPREVPFVSTLSGGIDSAIISLFASDFGRERIPTLYGQSAATPARNHAHELDEWEASQFTAGRIGSAHTHIHLDDTACVPVLERLATNSLDGVLDPGVASFEMLGHHVRGSGAKVILISDGPDELIGGYNVDRRSYLADRRHDHSPNLFAALRFVSASRFGRSLLRRLGRHDLVVAPHLSYAPFAFTPVHESLGMDALRHLGVAGRTAAASADTYGVDDPAYAELLPHLDWSQRRALAYAARTLPDLFNLRTDKGFLRASVESRVPFQAPALAELMIASPTMHRFGADGSTTKHILRRIVERHVGPQVAWRSKHGFSAPIWQQSDVRRTLGIDERGQYQPLFAALGLEGLDEVTAPDPRFDLFKWPLFALARSFAALGAANAARQTRLAVA